MDPVILEKLIMIAVGTGFLIAGYTLYRLGIKAIGAYLGALAGMGLWRIAIEVFLYQHLTGENDYKIGLIISAIVFGIAGAFFAIRFYSFLVFFATFFGGLYIYYTESLGPVNTHYLERTEAFQSLYEHVGDLAPALVILVFAGAMVFFQRHIVILATAATGAYLIATETYIYLFPALLVVGLVSQFAARRRVGKFRGEDPE